MMRAVAQVSYFLGGVCVALTLTLASPTITMATGAAAPTPVAGTDRCDAISPEVAIGGGKVVVDGKEVDKTPTGGDKATLARLGSALKGTSCNICVNQGGRVLLPYGIQGSENQNSFWCFVTGVLNYNAGLINLIAIGWVAWFGLQYALGMGDSSKQKAAKEAIIGIVTGIIFITLTRFLLTILGGPAKPL